MAVEVLAGSVIPHRGPRIGVPGGDLDVPQIHAGVEHGGDEGMAEHMRVRPDDPHPGGFGEAPQAAGGGVAIHPGAPAVEQDRAMDPAADGLVDGPSDGWRQRDQDDLGAFAAHAQHPVAMLSACAGAGSSPRRLEQARADQALAEDARARQLQAACAAHDLRVKAIEAEVREHNAAVDELEGNFLAGVPDAVEEYFSQVLALSEYPTGFLHAYQVAYRQEPRELVIEYRLPPVDVIPGMRDFRYVKTRSEVDELARPVREIKDLYAAVIHQVALRTMWECFAVTVAADVVDTVVFNGIVPATNRATGQAEELHLISAPASRSDFSQLVLDQLEPGACLKHLKAILSPHPYDLEPVEPVIEFQKAKYRFADPVDALAGIDSRPDLLKMDWYTKGCVSRPTVSRLCGDVAQVRVCEERPDQSRAFLESPQGTGGLGFQVLLARDASLADPVVFHVLPDPLIGVELRRVAGQAEQLQAAFRGDDEFARGGGTVRGMPVHDEINRPGGIVQQPLAEIDEGGRVRVPLVDGEPQRAFRGHRGDHVHRKPGPGVAHLRGLADGRPGGARVVVRADPGLISEPDCGSLRFGLRLDSGILLTLPPLDGLRVLLVSAVQGPLRRHSQLAQQPAHADHRQGDAEFAADHLADHLPGPQRELELHLPRILPGDQRIQPRQLRAAQLRRPARHRLSFQCGLAALAVFRQPGVDRLAVQSQRGGHILRMRAFTDLIHRPDPQRLKGLVIKLPAVVIAHGTILPDHKIKVRLLSKLLSKFENLIRQLFEAMGLEVRVTQSSRDEGIDAVAYNKTDIVRVPRAQKERLGCR